MGNDVRSLRWNCAALALGIALICGSARAAEITGITIESVSSEFGGRPAIASVNGSGLTGLEHNTSIGAMWLSNGSDGTPEVVYDLGGNYTVTNITVWNYNEAGSAARGVNNVDVLGSLDAGSFTLIVNTNFTIAPAASGYLPNTFVTNTAIARYIKLDVMSNHGGGGFTGLSEIKFYGDVASIIALDNPGVSSITTTSATASVTLVEKDGDVTAFWKAGVTNPPFGTTGWDGTNGPAAETTGLVMRAISGLSPDTLYTVAFLATNGTDPEAWSVGVQFSTALSAAQTPAFTIASASLDVVTLGWSDNATNETGYVLQRSESGSGGPYDPIGTLPSDTTSYIDAFVPLGTIHYRVAATNSTNGSGTDLASAETNVATTWPGDIIYIDPVTGVTVSTEYQGRIGDNLVNESGLDTNSWTHDADINSMWLTPSSDTNPLATFDFGEVYTVKRMHVWNYNELAHSDRGVKDLVIRYGQTPALGKTVSGITTFEAAPASSPIRGEAFAGFAPFSARYVEFDIETRHSDPGLPPDWIGLSEVIFLGTPGGLGTVVTLR